MRKPVNKSRRLKVVCILAFSGFFAGVSFLENSQPVEASADGPTASFTNAPGEGNCTACHTSYELNSGTGGVQISGVPPNYVPGQNIQITVTTSQEDGVVFGFEITAIDSTGVKAGNFVVPVAAAEQMQTKDNVVGNTMPRQYVEHQRDGLFTQNVFGSNSWTFTWTAPAQSQGKIDFYVAGNAANGDGTNSGDYIYTNATSTSPGSASVTISGKVKTPEGTGLKSAKVTLIDGTGGIRSVTTNSFGLYSFTDVPTGPTYTLTAQSKRYRFSSKSIQVTGQLANLDFTGLE